MPSRAKDQLGLDEQVIEDADIEAALEEREKRKSSLSAVNKLYQAADELAKAELTKLELPEGGAARVGRFRVTRSAIPARSVTFDTKASSRIRISLAEGAEAPAKGAAKVADEDADLRPKGPVDVRAIRNAADGDAGAASRRSRKGNGEAASLN